MRIFANTSAWSYMPSLPILASLASLRSQKLDVYVAWFMVAYLLPHHRLEEEKDGTMPPGHIILHFSV